MIRRLALVLAALWAAGPALALKCADPDVVRSFRAAMESPDQYVVLRGRFAFDEALLPGDVTTRGNPGLPPPAPIASAFSGHALDPDGFTRELSIPVTLEPVCLGPWCGRIADDTDLMVFARVADAGELVVRIDPCNAWIFPEPDAQSLEQARACKADPASCAS